jgi:hypothetical protein
VLVCVLLVVAVAESLMVDMQAHSPAVFRSRRAQTIRPPVVVISVVLAENVVLAGQAACWYSWMAPPARSRRRTRKVSRSVISAGSGLSGAALDRAI